MPSMFGASGGLDHSSNQNGQPMADSKAAMVKSQNNMFFSHTFARQDVVRNIYSVENKHRSTRNSRTNTANQVARSFKGHPRNHAGILASAKGGALGQLEDTTNTYSNKNEVIYID